MFRNFYKGKKVLVTGDTGFKGSWLCLWLLSLGADVVGYALEPNTEPNLFETLNLRHKIKHITADIRNYEKLFEVIDTENPDIIFHLAAQPLVRYSYQNPKETYETNVMGTINLFESIRKLAKEVIVINVTTDKCYENKEWIYGYREIDPMGGYDPYSNSKGCSELVTSSYRNSFFNSSEYGKTHKIALASARAGNVIGGGDWSIDRLVPDCVKSLVKNEIIKIKRPLAVRPWQFVLEPLSGYLTLPMAITENIKNIEKVEKIEKFASGWNFGPLDNSVLTVQNIVENILNVWQKGEYKIEKTDDLHEATLLKLDISKAINYLDWMPVYDAKEAIIETIEWYKNFYLKTSDNLEFSINQIKKYQKNSGK
jgi:CDP-glucose 4,6-dehydratase